MLAEIESVVGKTIKSVKVTPHSAEHLADYIELVTEDGSGVRIWDNDQQCCETRFITCDDNLSQYVGATFLGVEFGQSAQGGDVKNDGEEHNCDDQHDIIFLHMNTDRGRMTFQTHNVHNGYYSGFCVVAERLEVSA